MIKFAGGKLHWNYFLALERDAEALSRYVEFCDANRSAFSLELAHLLFAAASEVDVVAKGLCKIVTPHARCENINNYRSIITKALPDFALTTVEIPRHEMTLTPWENWSKGKNPDWWKSYNNVKHERDKYFNEATLQNMLNAMGALMVITFEYYHAAKYHNVVGISPWDTNKELLPAASLFRLPKCYPFGYRGDYI